MSVAKAKQVISLLPQGSEFENVSTEAKKESPKTIGFFPFELETKWKSLDLKQERAKAEDEARKNYAPVKTGIEADKKNLRVNG